MSHVTRLLLFVSSVIWCVPTEVAHAGDMTWLIAVSKGLNGVVNFLVPTLVAVCIAYFVWGMVMFIAKADVDQAREEGKKRMVWGVVGLFVVVAVWGFVSLLIEVTGISPKDANQVTGITQPTAKIFPE